MSWPVIIWIVVGVAIFWAWQKVEAPGDRSYGPIPFLVAVLWPIGLALIGAFLLADLVEWLLRPATKWWRRM